MRETTAAFTGHRPQHLKNGDNENSSEILQIKDRLYRAICTACDEGFNSFISGMSLGADIWAAEAVLALREERPGISLECAVPCAVQADRWSRPEQIRYRSLLDRADKVTILSERYYAGCMFRRNCYMVDRSSLLIAVYSGKAGGGTSQTVQYALRRGIRIENVL